MSDSAPREADLPEGPSVPVVRAPAPRAAGPSGAARGRGRPKGSKTKTGKAAPKPADARAAIPKPGAPSAPQPAPAPAAAPLLVKNAAELAEYMAKGGFLAHVYTLDKPRLAELAKGMAWADIPASLQRVQGGGSAVPAAHVKMAAELAFPFLAKSGILSANILSDEYKFAAAMVILAGPMIPAMWKCALYREPVSLAGKKPPEKKPAGDKPSDSPAPGTTDAQPEE